jgi:hypothetical protein
MLLNISRYLKPDLFCPNLDALDFPALFQDGYRLVLIDVDNTLARHGSFKADAYARRAIRNATEAGFSCRIISNAGNRRIQAYAATLEIPYIAWAKKPSIRAILQACRSAGVETAKAIMIGDQILTDVVSAHRAGCFAVLVHPRYHQEALHIRLKRFVERLVFWRYKLSSDRPRRYRSDHPDKSGPSIRKAVNTPKDRSAGS